MGGRATREGVNGRQFSVPLTINRNESNKMLRRRREDFAAKKTLARQEGEFNFTAEKENENRRLRVLNESKKKSEKPGQDNASKQTLSIVAVCWFLFEPSQ